MGQMKDCTVSVCCTNHRLQGGTLKLGRDCDNHLRDAKYRLPEIM